MLSTTDEEGNETVKVTKTLKWVEGKGTCLVLEVAEAVSELEEPALCECGEHYVGATCKAGSK